MQVVHFYPRLVSPLRHPRAFLLQSFKPRAFTSTRLYRAEQSPPHPRPIKRPAVHGSELPPRPEPVPIALRKYIFSSEFLLRGLYRSLLIAVFAIPLWILWEGPIKTNHTDGEYEPFDLVDRYECASAHSHFILRRQTPQRYWWAWYEPEIPEQTQLGARTPIMSVKVKNPSLEIERSYTPLNLSPNEIHLVVKRYPEGELSRYLHVLTTGVATVWVKQGRHEWVYEEGKWDHVLFVVGGTGITPAFQLCLNGLQRQKLRGEEDLGSRKKTKFTVLAATRDVKSMLLREEFKTIEKLYGEGNLSVKYFLDTVPKGAKLPADMVQGPITEKSIHDAIRPAPVRGWLDWRKPSKAVAPEEENVMVLVCGPDGFTRYIAGAHGEVVSKQGVKGGLLRNVEGIELFKMLESRDVDDPVMNRKKEERRGMQVMKVE